MTPYELSKRESEIIQEVQAQSLSPQKKWEDPRLASLKGKIKKHYIEEQEYKCAYCQVEINTTHGMVWDTEHIIDKDGSPQWMFEALNLCVSCKDCNIAKGTNNVTKGPKYKSFPKKSSNYRIIHPHFDQYFEHIEVAIPGVTYRYITPKGRYTMDICGLLRYHKSGGRKQVDLALKSVLLAAAHESSEEMLDLALEYLLKRKANSN